MFIIAKIYLGFHVTHDMRNINKSQTGMQLVFDQLSTGVQLNCNTFQSCSPRDRSRLKSCSLGLERAGLGLLGTAGLGLSFVTAGLDYNTETFTLEYINDFLYYKSE